MAGLTGCLAAWMAALRCHGSGSKRKWHILGEILWSYLGYCDSVVVELPLPQPQYLYLLLLLLLVVFPRAAEWPTHTYIHRIRHRQTQINISGPRTTHVLRVLNLCAIFIAARCLHHCSARLFHTATFPLSLYSFVFPFC